MTHVFRSLLAATWETAGCEVRQEAAMRSGGYDSDPGKTFAERIVFEVHPRCSKRQYFIPSY